MNGLTMLPFLTVCALAFWLGLALGEVLDPIYLVAVGIMIAVSFFAGKLQAGLEATGANPSDTPPSPCPSDSVAHKR